MAALPRRLAAPIVLAVILATSACSEPPRADGTLSPARVVSGPGKPVIVVIDGKRYDYGYTGLQRFCVNGASLADLQARSLVELETLQRHYELCLQQRADAVLAEMARRGDTSAINELARRKASSP